mgnify:CR=1 FL=1
MFGHGGVTAISFQDNCVRTEFGHGGDSIFFVVIVLEGGSGVSDDLLGDGFHGRDRRTDRRRNRLEALVSQRSASAVFREDPDQSEGERK